MTRLRASAGSSSPLNVPFTRSYAPASPYVVPGANGAASTMRISVSRACTGAAMSSRVCIANASVRFMISSLIVAVVPRGLLRDRNATILHDSDGITK
jgi:hypothetical protein